MQRDSKVWYLVLINLVLVALCWWLAASNYSILPDEIPTHFGFSGLPDGWGGKGAIFIEPAVATGILLLSLGLGLLMPRIPKGMLNVPRKGRIEKLPEEARRRVYCWLYPSVATFLFIVDIPLNLLFLFITLTTIKVAQCEWEGLNNGIMWSLLACLVIYVAAWTVWMYRKVNRLVEGEERKLL